GAADRHASGRAGTGMNLDGRIVTTKSPDHEGRRRVPIGSRAGSDILLIDDDSAVRESLRRVLASEGWQVRTAASGAAALEQLSDREPDVIVTDLRLDLVSGWDVLFHERLQRPNLPVIVITALPRAQTGGADRFASEFFEKPVDPAALVEAVRRQIS